MTPQRFKKIKKCLQKRQNGLTVVMENVHKAHNLAAIARTCDAVGIGEIHAVTELDKITLSQNASSGVDRWLNVNCYKHIDEIFSELRPKGFQILAAHFEKQAVDFKEIDYTIPTAIVVGQELDGLTSEAVSKVDKCILIPMYGMVQSLNVSVATAVILYEAQRQRERAGMYDNVLLNNKEMNNILFEKCYPRIAKYYRKKNEKYPELDENGNIVC